MDKEITQTEAEYLKTIIKEITGRRMTVGEILEYGTHKQLMEGFDDKQVGMIAFNFILVKVFLMNGYEEVCERSGL